MHRPLKFKDFYLKETDIRRNREGKIKMLVYGQNYIFFFNFEGDVYGGSEDARLTYATMKTQDNDEGSEEMVFSARNLSSEFNEEPNEDYFTIDDIKHIEIITNREAEHLLYRMAAK